MNEVLRGLRLRLSRWVHQASAALQQAAASLRQVAAVPRRPSWWPGRVPGGFRLWISLVSLGFVLAALLSHARQLRQLSLDPQGWLWLLLGLGLSLLSLVVSGLAWGVLLRWLGLLPRWEPLVSLYMATNLRKFLPGGIWHLASRVQALRGDDPCLPAPTGTAMALVAVLLEPLLAAVAALALVSLGGWQNGLGLLALLPLAVLLPRWLNPLLQRLERRRARDLGLEKEFDQEAALPDAAPNPAVTPSAPVPGSVALRGYPWLPLLAQLAFVALRFGGFACCVWAFDLQNSLDGFSWLAGFALAWTAGLVVPGAPGGLGVFEAVLLLRLGTALPEAPLLAVALSYRLVATLSDLMGAGLVALDDRLQGLQMGGGSQ
jgi:glycosyltransferase 2 family protein